MIGRYLLLAITLTWLCWVPAVLMPSGIETVSGRVLVYAGGLGPLAAVTIVLLPRAQARAPTLSAPHRRCACAPFTCYARVSAPAADVWAAGSGVLWRGARLCWQHRFRSGSSLWLCRSSSSVRSPRNWPGAAMGSRHCSGITAHWLQRLSLPRLWSLARSALLHPRYLPSRAGVGHGWRMAFLRESLGAIADHDRAALAAPTVWSAVIFHWSTNLSGAVLPWSLVVELHGTNIDHRWGLPSWYRFVHRGTCVPYSGSPSLIAQPKRQRRFQRTVHPEHHDMTKEL